VPEKANEDMHGERAGWRGKEMAEKERWARLGSEFGVSELKKI
jgi:hypothetical protein